MEVLLNNIHQLGFRAGGVLIGIWGLYVFFKSIFGAGGLQPVRLITAVLMVVLGAAAFQMLPKLISVGQDTGGQISGGGYSMHAPAGLENSAPPAGWPTL